VTTHAPNRFLDLGLVLLTVTLATFGALSFRQQRIYQPPSDNVFWVATGQGLRAEQVSRPGAGWRAGIRPGDLLIGVAGQPVTSAEQLQRAIFGAGAGRTLPYALLRAGHIVVARVRVARATSRWRRFLIADLVGLLYLAIGIFVILRRRSARLAVHFYLFCLASFVLYAFHFTGKLNSFDWTVFWCNEIALLLAPPLLLHFALVFPRAKGILKRLPGLAALLYAPAGAFLLLQAAFATGALQSPAPAAAVQRALDRVPYALFAAAFVLAAVAFFHTLRHASSNLQRQQMQWIAGGVTLALIPFLALYVVPYLRGVETPPLSTLALAAMALVPLSIGYAVVRYRLMDVDAVFRRGIVYSLATMAVVAIYFAAIGLAAALIHLRVPNLGAAGWILAIVVTALLFEPMKNWLQERLDRAFYRDRYDYRRTLLEFGRQMSAEPELEPLLARVVERLSATLSLPRVAVFVRGEGGQFTLARSRGLAPAAPCWNAAALPPPEPGASPWRYFENPAHGPCPELDLNYYLACESQGRTVAWLGFARAGNPGLLTSDDLQLLETLANPLAIAIDNARLYETLRSQAREYERLKEFNENIVESVAAGVAAVSEDDRIESWNARMETLAGVPRAAALGRTVGEIFGVAFAREYYRLRAEPGVANLYKLEMTLGGERRVVNLALAPLVTRQFQVVGRILLLDDITARVELERRLAQAERLSSVGLLAAGVAHEVNTPLAVISNYTQLLAKQLPADDPRAALVERITRQTFRASEIVGSLLNFSRGGSGRRVELDLNQVITETLALVEHPLRTAGIRVVSELADGLPAVAGDSGRLQQVFLNLILNARDAMPHGGTLRLQTQCDGERVRAAVADSGVGIPEDARDRIFDPFFTTKVPDRSRQDGLASGTGLGLSVTYGIIQEHGGTIQVASEPGQGTCFYVEFPAVRRAVHA